MIIIIGILLAIAVPSYLGFKRVPRRRGEVEHAGGVPSAEAYSPTTATYAHR